MSFQHVIFFISRRISSTITFNTLSVLFIAFSISGTIICLMLGHVFFFCSLLFAIFFSYSSGPFIFFHSVFTVITSSLYICNCFQLCLLYSLFHDGLFLSLACFLIFAISIFLSSNLKKIFCLWSYFTDFIFYRNL